MIAVAALPATYADFLLIQNASQVPTNCDCKVFAVSRSNPLTENLWAN